MRSHAAARVRLLFIIRNIEHRRFYEAVSITIFAIPIHLHGG